MSECQRCERPVQDAHVCTLCGRDLERALGNIPAIAHELTLVISRQTNYQPQSDGGHSADTPLAFNDKASEAHWTLRNILVGWVKLYAEEARADLPHDELPAMSRFLLRRVEWLRHHELAAECVDEITEAVRNAARVCDAPANRTTFPVGPCPETLEDGAQCPGEIRAFIPNSEQIPARMECTSCGKVYETHQWLHAGRRILRRGEQANA